ncbi:MAG: copper amine oxidase N-terminal domain-containing protein [Methylocystaceae bacterium]
MKLKHKAIILVWTAALVLLPTLSASAAVSLNINDRSYQALNSPIMQDDRVSTTLDVLIDTIGCDISVQDKTITLKENQNTLIMNLGSKTALYNGLELTMPFPPQMFGDQIYVPVRFVYETLGATVNWEEKTNTVKIDYNETRNGMTAEDIVLKSSDKAKQAGRYKMFTNAKYDINMTMQESGKNPETIKATSDSEITAWYQIQPILMYIKQKAVVTTAGVEAAGPETVETETLLNENGMYIKMPETGWVKMDLPGINLQTLMKQSMNQDPATAMQQMKDTGMSLALANDQEKNGSKYWVIDSKMGSEFFKSDYFKQMMGQMKGTAGEMDMQQMFEAIEMDMSYSSWINQETMDNNYLLLKAKIKMPVNIPSTPDNAAGKMDMDMGIIADYAISDYGKPFTVPDITGAKSMSEIAPKVK